VPISCVPLTSPNGEYPVKRRRGTTGSQCFYTLIAHATPSRRRVKRSLNCKETPPVRAGFFIPASVGPSFLVRIRAQ